MSSKISLVFNNIPDAGTEIVFVDSKYPDTEIKIKFVVTVTKPNEVAITNNLFFMALNTLHFIRDNYPNINYSYVVFYPRIIIESSDLDSQFSVITNTTSDKITIVLENAFTGGAPKSFPGEATTPINDASKISFVNSPVHLKVQDPFATKNIQKATVYLWIWNGDLYQTLGKPNLTLSKNKISQNDNYINFQIADYIKSFIENPPNALNTNQPQFAYNELTPPAITGLGAFYQVVTDITSDGNTTRLIGETNFATLGYRWNYEQSVRGNNGVLPNGSTGFLRDNQRWYNPKIHNYISQSFDLTKNTSEANAGNIIITTPITPPAKLERCSRDSSLIVYLNKLGLWEMFTPHGKILISSDIDSNEQSKLFRDAGSIDNDYTHSKLKDVPNIEQTYVINTGSLTETMVDQVEEIIYSPKIYLILFNGNIQANLTQGITIDSTFITIDDTNITIDSATVTEEFLGKFKSFQQIPVINMDNNFVRKTRVNDKNEINYNLKFKETNNKLLDIR